MLDGDVACGRRMGDFSPIQRGLRIGRKGADRSDRTIGHNGEQILISEIGAVRDGTGRTVYLRLVYRVLQLVPASQIC